jgi:hypothetical protein
MHDYPRTPHSRMNCGSRAFGTVLGVPGFSCYCHQICHQTSNVKSAQKRIPDSSASATSFFCRHTIQSPARDVVTPGSEKIPWRDSRNFGMVTYGPRRDRRSWAFLQTQRTAPGSMAASSNARRRSMGPKEQLRKEQADIACKGLHKRRTRETQGIPKEER